jgi:choline dehydrogenase-like flavoprotein
MGGSRIGCSFKDPVVDKNLKVHRVSNLFVNGIPVFRTSGQAHPTCTIVFLTLRLSQNLSSL